MLKYDSTFRHDEKRYFRYCTECALKYKWLKLVDNGEERYYARGPIYREKEVDISLGVKSIQTVLRFPSYGRFCSACGEPTSAIPVSSFYKNDRVQIKCNNLNCALYQQTQETIDVVKEKNILPLGVKYQKCISCGQTLARHKKWSDKDHYMEILKCDNWRCKMFTTPIARMEKKTVTV
jgi:hypothetical protein